MGNPNTETGGLEPRGGRARVTKSHPMKLDGTVTYGNLITAASALIGVAFGYGVLTNRMDASDQRATQQRAEFSQAVVELKESIKDQRTEMKEVQRSINAITTDTALIRGRLASDGASTTRAPK